MARMPNMDNSTASASWVDQSLTVRTKLSNKQDADTCSSLSDSSLLCTDIKRELSFCVILTVTLSKAQNMSSCQAPISRLLKRKNEDFVLLPLTFL